VASFPVCVFILNFVRKLAYFVPHFTLADQFSQNMSFGGHPSTTVPTHLCTLVWWEQH